MQPKSKNTRKIDLQNQQRICSMWNAMRSNECIIAKRENGKEKAYKKNHIHVRNSKIWILFLHMVTAMKYENSLFLLLKNKLQELNTVTKFNGSVFFFTFYFKKSDLFPSKA